MWIWGDTLVGNLYTSNGQEKRNITRMPHNTVAIVDMSGDRKPTFYVPENNRGQFYPKYDTDTNVLYWVIDGVVGPDSGKLILIAMVIKLGGGGLGFQQIGADIIIVNNPQEVPTSWDWNCYRIPSSNDSLSWSASMAYHPSDKLIYIVGQDPKGQVLSRMSEADLLKQNWPAMQFWTGSAWQTSTNTLATFINVPFTFTETTLMHHTYLNKWYMVCSQAYQSYIYVALADDITGPWTTTKVYTIPPPWNNGNLYTNYAAKSHPEFATSQNQIVFTYNTNSVTGLQGLATEVGAYHPHFIILTIT